MQPPLRPLLDYNETTRPPVQCMPAGDDRACEQHLRYAFGPVAETLTRAVVDPRHHLPSADTLSFDQIAASDPRWHRINPPSVPPDVASRLALGSSVACALLPPPSETPRSLTVATGFATTWRQPSWRAQPPTNLIALFPRPTRPAKKLREAPNTHRAIPLVAPTKIV